MSFDKKLPNSVSYFILLLLAIISILVVLISYKIQQDATHTPSQAKEKTMQPQIICDSEIVDNQIFDTGSVYLYDISAINVNDIWTVGATQSAIRSTFIKHWNGSNWSVVSSPIQTSYDTLYGVKALGSDNVWAVGESNLSDIYHYNTLIEHWNGVHWEIVTSPNENGYNDLQSIDGVSSTDLWAVGSVGVNMGATQSLILHWNGISWSTLPSVPQFPETTVLNDVWANTADDVWAVGYTGLSSLILHWNGNEWSRITSPNVPSTSTILKSVSGSADNDIWAVGYSSNSQHNLTLSMHWGGQSWSIVSSPNSTRQWTYLLGVKAIRSDDVWAQGSGRTLGNGQTFMLHWNGSIWAIVPSQNNPSESSILTGITALNSNSIWSVGNSSNPSQTLILSRVCNQPSVTPTDIPSPSPQSDMCKANIDGNNAIDSGDFNILKQEVGRDCKANKCRADFNCDGFIDKADYSFFSQYFGLGCPAATPLPCQYTK